MSDLAGGERPRATSVIVPVYNQGEAFAHCLEALRDDGRSGRRELLVVDNGSTDRSAEIARAFGARVLESSAATPAGVRNAGAAAATGDVLVFVDSDVQLEAGWIPLAADLLRAGVAAAAGGPRRVGAADGWVSRATRHLEPASASANEVAWLSTSAVAVSRAAFDDVGGFDAGLETCEDQDLSWRLRERGGRLRFEPRLGWYDLGRAESLGQHFRRERWRGRDNLRASLRRAPSSRELVGAAYPVVQIGLVGIALATAALPVGRALPVVLGAVGLLVGLALLRAFLLWRRLPRPDRAPFLEVLAVSGVHDAARATALVAPARHPRRDASSRR